MRSDGFLANEYARLKAATNAHNRGYEFQAFVGNLFRREHFTVVLNARSSRPRQVDLLATRGSDSYLVETKWRKDRANSDDIASLFDRLRRTDVTTVGVLVSHAGFTPEVLAEVVAQSNRPVLLFQGSELDSLALEWVTLVQLLNQKRAHLVTHREVLLDVARSSPRARSRRKAPQVPQSSLEFEFPNGQRSTSLSCLGDFGQFTFVRELPDIDWVPASGVGVTLDIALGAGSQDDALTIVRRLAEMGWSTPTAQWNIQQAEANWHGLGPDAFLSTLAGWKQRYAGQKNLHHSEEFCYFDICDGGFYTLTGGVSARSPRSVARASLSFQLVGIPLDLEPFKELHHQLGADERLYFRPRKDDSVSRINRTEADRPLKVHALIVDRDHTFNEENWVVGIVASNPAYRPPGSKRKILKNILPGVVSDCEYIICDLRSWHRLEGRKRVYRLWSVSSARTSDALVLTAVAEWD